ncbi:MmyB family transcriptional regulator [Streptomyces mesophilus]|uniref:MmyB family transcriptional regulator n=1 Tax=Streptomyces mesophilus TaxID=1775132 RepID=UPI0038B64863
MQHGLLVPLTLTTPTRQQVEPATRHQLPLLPRRRRLRAKRREFLRLWETRDVAAWTNREYVRQHPSAGELRLTGEWGVLPDDPGVGLSCAFRGPAHPRRPRGTTLPRTPNAGRAVSRWADRRQRVRAWSPRRSAGFAWGRQEEERDPADRPDHHVRETDRRRGMTAVRRPTNISRAAAPSTAACPLVESSTRRTPIRPQAPTALEDSTDVRALGAGADSWSVSCGDDTLKPADGVLVGSVVGGRGVRRAHR